MIWINSDQITCCIVFLLLPVLWMIFICASWVIFLVAALAASWWTNWCLHSCCVPVSDLFDRAPFDWLDSDPLLPGCGVRVAMIWWCGIGTEDHNEKKWEVLRNIYLGSCRNRINCSQLVGYTEDESCYVWMQLAGVCHRPRMCNRLG